MRILWQDICDGEKQRRKKVRVVSSIHQLLTLEGLPSQGISVKECAPVRWSRSVEQERMVKMMKKNIILISYMGHTNLIKFSKIHEKSENCGTPKIWRNLNLQGLNYLCTKFGWAAMIRFGEEDFWKIVDGHTDRRTDRQTDRRTFPPLLKLCDFKEVSRAKNPVSWLR